jgi:2-(1,2-epoxy-1,2-dihydrophenyl)acetyl-CoA isomerase
MVLRAEVVDGVGHLTLDRPDQGNAIDLELAEALAEVTAAWSVDPAVRCVLLSGEGRTFCVGGDLKAFRSQPHLPTHLLEVTDPFHAAVSRLSRMDAPVVAAVHGSAAGGGLSLALAADLVLAAASARFVVAYTAIGLTPDGSGSWTLPRLVGLRRALELTLTNRPLTAVEALAEGLVTRVVPDDALRQEAGALAAALAAGPTGALGAAKRLVRDALDHDLEAQLALEARSRAAAAGSDDAAEGIAAFLEKRPARFSGRDRW